MLIDTDVLVWMTRGHLGAAQRLSQLLPWQLSVVTYIELAQGCRTKVELNRLKKGLAQSGAHILPLTPSISQRAMELIDGHVLSHGLQLGDALIAATAVEHGLTLLSANAKHFAKLPGVRLEVFKP
ncbi:MAG: type II toxin-antitoxin system VapC family toxin [Rhodoferax sp.]